MDSTSNSNHKVKCVVAGPSMSGKTAMVNVLLEGRVLPLLTGHYSHGLTNIGYGATIYDDFYTTMKIDGDDVAVTIVDTGGHPDHESISSLPYPSAEVFILVVTFFGQGGREGLLGGYDGGDESEICRWMQKLQDAFPGGHCPPIVLVGAKMELRGKVVNTDWRTGQNIPIPSYLDGVKLANRIGATTYIECSAKSNVLSCKKVFEAAVREAIKFQKGESTQSPSNALSFVCCKNDSVEQDDQR